jgi:hypothetical protein
VEFAETGNVDVLEANFAGDTRLIFCRLKSDF